MSHAHTEDSSIRLGLEVLSTSVIRQFDNFDQEVSELLTRVASVTILSILLLNVLAVCIALPNEAPKNDVMWIEPSTVAFPSSVIGYRFIVTLFVNLSFTCGAWQFHMLYDRSQLNATACCYTSGTKSQFFQGISTVPVAPGFGAYNSSHGRVAFGESWSGMGPMRDPGYGSLAYVEFEVIAEPSLGEAFAGTIDISSFALPSLLRTYVINADKQNVVIPVYDAVYGFEPKFKIGDRVQTTANLNVREGPGLSYDINDTMPNGTLGRIMGGPVRAYGYTWWKVNYDTDVEGWSAEDWLEATGQPDEPPFSVGDCVIIQGYSRLYQEPRLDSDSHVIYENQCGHIIENENNGVFTDGHFWWNVELQPIAFEYWVLEEAIAKNQPPTSSLSYAPQRPKANEEVVFDASESQDTDGKVCRYTWYLDGKFMGWTEVPIIFYAFEREGSFALKVEVTDDCYESRTREVTVIVEGKTRPESIKKIISKDDLIKIADGLGIPHHTEDSGLWSHIEVFELNGERYSENDLLGVFNKPIKKISEAGMLTFVEDVIYGMRIRNILEDSRLVDLTSSGVWNLQEGDFENLKKTNKWVETVFLLANWEEPFIAEYLKNVAFSLDWPLSAGVHVVGGLIGPILTIAEGYRVYKRLDFLEDVLYKRALWLYMQEMIGGVDSVTAFDSVPVPIKYKSETTRKAWEKLYLTYEPYIIPGEGGLGENFETIKAELRKSICDMMESYSLMPRKFVRIGSAGELRVYDSEGGVTGMFNGEIREEIPNSIYDEETETIIIFPSIGSYRYEILGLAEGTYSLRITSIEYRNVTTFAAADISMKTGVSHQYTFDWAALSQGGEGATIEVDLNEDGLFEYAFTSDSELTRKEFLANTTIPGDLNNDGMVGIDDIFMAAEAFGSEPGHPRWNDAADVNDDGYVGIDDMFTVASHFGQGESP